MNKSIMFDINGKVITPGIHSNGGFIDSNGKVYCVRKDDSHETGDNPLYSPIGDGSGYVYGLGEIK